MSEPTMKRVKHKQNKPETTKKFANTFDEMWADDKYNVVLVETYQNAIKCGFSIIGQYREDEFKLKLPKRGVLKPYFTDKDGTHQYDLFKDEHYAQCVVRSLAESKCHLVDQKCLLCLKDVKWGYRGMIPEPCVDCWLDTYMDNSYDESLFLKVAQVMHFNRLAEQNVTAALQYTINLYDKHHNFANVSQREKQIHNFDVYFTKF